MKPMTYKELGEKVAEQALDDYLINGKTMREWINILSDNMSVLDKIRAEIKQEYDNQGDWSFNDGLAFALDIIDKYKAERTDKE